MSDLISRKAAIDALKGLPTWWADEGRYYGKAQPPMVALLDPEDAVNAIDNLPSATCGNLEKPERQQHSEGEAADCNLDCISRQDAIDILDAFQVKVENGEEFSYSWARMRMTELPSTQPKISSSEIPNTSDTISRQAAIDTIDSVLVEDESCKVWFKLAVKNLPSAQPDLDEWCTDCSEYDAERHCCPRFNRVIRDAVKEAKEERKTGKWLPDNNNYCEERFICSVCGRSYKVDTCMGKPMWDFCPCGAKMEGEEA